MAAATAACLSYASSGPDAGAGGPDATTAGNSTSPGGASPTGAVSIVRDGGSPISPFAFGQNYWDWVDWSKDGLSGLTGTESLVGALHLNAIRAGGNNNDQNSPLFDTGQIDKFVAYCRMVGAEPILQVPLLANNVDAGPPSAQAAADMVTYANGMKGYGVKYWEIGNEPDLYSRTYDAGSAPVTPEAYCAAFKTYAMAMRAADKASSDGGPPIQLLGPELSYQYTPGTDWLTPFLDGCKDDVDIVTVHRYPFSGAMTSVNGALSGAASFQSMLHSVGGIVRGHARPNTPLGITETNISYDYTQSAYTPTSSLAGPGTFYAAMWTADIVGTALENNLWTLALWNLAEKSTKDSVLGYIVGDQPTPAYYGQQLISGNFRGSILAPTGTPAGFSVYASYDATKATTAVLVLNKNSSASTLAIAIDTLASQAFDFPPMSMTLIQIPDDPGGATQVQRYTAELADAGMPPQAIE